MNWRTENELISRMAAYCRFVLSIESCEYWNNSAYFVRALSLCSPE